MKALKALAIAFVLSILAACGTTEKPEQSTSHSQKARSGPPPTAGAEAPATESRSEVSRGLTGESEASLLKVSSDADVAARQEPSQSVDRKIIRNATLVIETDDPATAQRKMGSIAESYGGFIVSSDYKAGSPQSGVTVNVILRVPTSAFEATLTAVRATGGNVMEDNVSGKDVTEEYIDLEARIRTKKALEAQFLEIMKQARKVSDALEVQSQIADVRTEIERLEGRRRFLENQSSLSTITVTFKTPAPVVTATTTGFAHSIKEAFGESIDLAAAIVLGLIRIVIVMIPVLVLIILPFGLFVRYLLRRYHTPKPSEPIAQA